MAFVARNYEQILTDMIAHVRANTTLTDFTVGSIIRTILEASALEDDEQYFQMVQLLDAFRIATSSGSDLDERVADYNIVRLKAASASGQVTFRNENLITDFLSINAAAAALTTILQDSSDFPTSGYPYTVRIGEGTPQVEDVSVTNNNTATNTLTHGALSNSHTSGERVSQVTGGAKSVSSGQLVQVPSQGTDSAIAFTSTNAVVIADGNYESSPVSVKANTAGKSGNVSATRISQFQGSAPFVGAGVTNKKATQGGRDLETDEELRVRALEKLNELSRGTKFAIESGILETEDTATGQQVKTAKLQESFVDPNNNILYIDDGSGS